MRFKKLLYLFVCSCLLYTAVDFSIFSPLSVEAATAKKKSSSKKSSTKKSSSKKSTSGKSGKKSKSSSKKRKNSRSNGSKNRKKTLRSKKGRNAAKTRYVAPPKETPQNDSLTLAVNSYLISTIPEHLNPGGLRVNSVKPNRSGKSASISLNENFTYLPVTKGLIDTLSRNVQHALPDSISDYRVLLTVNGRPLSYYITKVDKLPEQYRKNPTFVSEVYPYTIASKGLDNDIIALWHSHGRYFKSGSWQWQRPLLFQTVEDTYTMSYILPFVVPMLENAGAYVFLPRERDTNRNEVIVDNDINPEGRVFSQSTYKESNGLNKWTTGEYEGFIYDLPDFRDTENPFENGSYRQVKTISQKENPSVAAWYADIPEDGEYAIYVSYKTLPNSTKDARYTVNYSGGSKEFTVNQQMGGGTWIYLCTVPLEEGYSDEEPVVTLTNVSGNSGDYVVTADAIKIGGGMGNIARSPNRSDIYYDPSTPDKDLAQNTANDEVNDEEADEESDEDEDEDETSTDDSNPDDVADNPDAELKPETPAPTPDRRSAPVFRTSGYPRFLEGARYWLHWAGFPEYVYSPYHGSNDYKDDYTSRGHWVNYLAGGSRVLPGRDGLNIPVDLALALHSDAGKRTDDSYVGTLGIYFSQNGGRYIDGTPRINSRMLTDMVMQQIAKDIRREWEPSWTRRAMWDQSYVEARVPEVPTTLIELMSHQNFADMQYGLDPEFRFTVGRAIYKGIARFLAERKDRKLVIQPLPVHNFSIKRTKPNHYRLSWEPTPDKLEPTAMPDKYVILERSGDDLGFHKIAETKNTHYDLRVADNEIHSFRIIATNEGGVSFPSETLALREAPDHSDPVLIINGFNRISGPGSFSSEGNAGFTAESDFGVPYVKDISFTGYQTEFRRSAGEGFGRSGSNFATQVIAGNTFDYPAVHGAAIAESGRGFISTSSQAVENDNVKLTDFKDIDLILGKQRTTITGRNRKGARYHILSDDMKKHLKHFTEKGGRLIVSGEYISSDLLDDRSSREDRDFAFEVLGLQRSDSHTAKSGVLRSSNGERIPYSATLNDKIYIVENPDILVTDERAPQPTRLLTFDGTSQTAAYAMKRNKGTVVVSSVPIEAITDAGARAKFIRQALNF